MPEYKKKKKLYFKGRENFTIYIYKKKSVREGN
jgi:hypothetical protein